MACIFRLHHIEHTELLFPANLDLLEKLYEEEILLQKSLCVDARANKERVLGGVTLVHLIPFDPSLPLRC